jgi:hypothetical protein
MSPFSGESRSDCNPLINSLRFDALCLVRASSRGCSSSNLMASFEHFEASYVFVSETRARDEAFEGGVEDDPVEKEEDDDVVVVDCGREESIFFLNFFFVFLQVREAFVAFRMGFSR